MVAPPPSIRPPSNNYAHLAVRYPGHPGTSAGLFSPRCRHSCLERASRTSPATAGFPGCRPGRHNQLVPCPAGTNTSSSATSPPLPALQPARLRVNVSSIPQLGGRRPAHPASAAPPPPPAPSNSPRNRAQARRGDRALAPAASLQTPPGWSFVFVAPRPRKRRSRASSASKPVPGVATARRSPHHRQPRGKRLLPALPSAPSVGQLGPAASTPGRNLRLPGQTWRLGFAPTPAYAASTAAGKPGP